VSEPESTLPPVAVVLGPGADETVVDHTRRVLNHFGIPFAQFDWREFEGLLASWAADCLRVVVFATGVAYTDEHLRLPVSAIVPVLRIITDSAPPAGQVLTNTPLMATAGYGIPSAVNAGLSAARILTTNDDVLRDLLRMKPYPVP
jgi:phosphoribosylcarboxyaminoimidazole (NCAIR) mutase